MKLPKFVNYLWIYGEARVIKTITKTGTKLLNKGITCAFTGYIDDYDRDYYRM